MKITFKEVLLGVIFPIVLTIWSIIYADNIKNSDLLSRKFLASVTPFILIFFSIWYFANILMKKLNKLQSEHNSSEMLKLKDRNSEMISSIRGLSEILSALEREVAVLKYKVPNSSNTDHKAKGE